MRRRDLEKPCREALPAFFEKHGMRYDDDVQVERAGWSNLCLFVGDDYVVRINTRDPDLPKFRGERAAYERLTPRGFPVPQVLVFDDERDIIPFDVLVTARLPGQNLEMSWRSLSLSVRHSLTEQAVDWLLRLHEVEFSRFGALAGDDTHCCWSATVLAQMGRHLREAGQLGTLEQSDIERFEDLFCAERVGALLDEIVVPSLIHADYHPGNLLHRDGQITGLLDFEWSFAGDRLFDLSYQQNLDGVGFPEAFFEAFGPMLDENDLRRQQLYKCMRNVELCNVARVHFPPDEAAQYRDATLDHLTWLEAVWP